MFENYLKFNFNQHKLNSKNALCHNLTQKNIQFMLIF